MQFEWDNRKARTNATKHGVTFEEATTIFGDELAITFDDPDHSGDESRFITFGVSVTQRHLIVVHTPRQNSERIISARPMTPGERRIYQDG